MLTKNELDILESGIIYEELHRIDTSTSNQNEVAQLMANRVLTFNKEHETNFNAAIIIENYLKVKRISDFSPLRPKLKRQKNIRKKF